MVSSSYLLRSMHGARCAATSYVIHDVSKPIGITALKFSWNLPGGRKLHVLPARHENVIGGKQYLLKNGIL